jgi:hypothetical protein
MVVPIGKVNLYEFQGLICNVKLFLIWSACCLLLNMCMISKTLPKFHRYKFIIMMSPLFLFVTKIAPVFCSESWECSQQIDGLVSIKRFLPYWWGDRLKNFLLFYDWNDNGRPMSLYIEQRAKKISTHSTKWRQKRVKLIKRIIKILS